MEVTVSLPRSSQHTQHSSTQLEQVSEVRSGMYTWSSPQEHWTTVLTSLRQKYKIFELRGVWIFLCRGDHLMLWYSVLSGSDHSHTTPQETTVTISWTVSPSLSLPNTLDTGQSHGTLSATTHTPPHSPHHPHHSHQSSDPAWGTIKGRRGWRGTCPWCFPWWREEYWARQPVSLTTALSIWLGVEVPWLYVGQSQDIIIWENKSRKQDEKSSTLYY